MIKPGRRFGMTRVHGKVLAFGGTNGVDPLDRLAEPQYLDSHEHDIICKCPKSVYYSFCPIQLSAI